MGVLFYVLQAVELPFRDFAAPVRKSLSVEDLGFRKEVGSPQLGCSLRPNVG